MSRPSADRWRNYFARTGFRPPRETLVAALDAFDREGRTGTDRVTVDLGCGNGRDTAEMLRRGWTVHAIDAEPAAVDALLERIGTAERTRLHTRVARFEHARWPPADLVNSSFALPLCPPGEFDALWARVVASLRPGGRFAGQLYGDRDDWAEDPSIACLERAALDRLLEGLEVETLREDESDGASQSGASKHWHVFHLVARRPARVMPISNPRQSCPTSSPRS